MNTKQLVNIGISLVAIVSALALPARADDIDEKQKALQTKINEARAAKLLTTADVRTLNKEMSDFNKKKTQLRTASGDALTLKDDQELDKALNNVNQDFENRKKQPAPVK